MSRTELLVRKLCSALWTSVVSAGQDHRLAHWLQTPLPRNDYGNMVASTTVPGEQAPGAAAAAPKRKLVDETPTTLLQPGSVQRLGTKRHAVEPPKAAIDANKALDNNNNLLLTAVIGAGGMQHTAAELADQRAIALSAIDDVARKHFDSAQVGIVPKLTQLLLVLTLEPCALSIDFVLHRRFDGDFVTRNFLATDRSQADGVGAWQRDVKRMSFNFFSRFPELCLFCDSTSSAAELEAIRSLWCLADQIFQKSSKTLHSESAARFLYNSMLSDLAADRAPLLEALARAHIGAGGSDPGRFTLRRQLFTEAFVCAQLHLCDLHAHATDATVQAQLTAGIDSLRRTRTVISQLTPPDDGTSPASV